MTKICDWCNKELPAESAVGASTAQEMGFTCDECAKRIVSTNGSNVVDFLHSLEAPVFVADSDARFIAANGEARRLAGGDPTEVEGWLVGDSFDCAAADLPGGCGKAECCRACIIRTAVTETMKSGRTIARRPGYLDVRANGIVQRKHYLISTLKAGDAVLLRIDPAD